jgi:hypothetical protein
LRNKASAEIVIVDTMHSLVVVPLLAVLLATISCVNGDGVFSEPRTVIESVENGKAEIVMTEVKMPAGKLRISGGATNLMDGEFVFTSAALEPRIRYDDDASRGRLTVEGTPGVSTTQTDGANIWEVRLNDDVPTELDVNLGAGECKLDLAGMALRGVTLKMGAGSCEVDLVGEWDRDFDVEVRGGVGQLTVRVPTNVGITADLKGGIGDIRHPGLVEKDGRYVNEALGEAPVTISLDVKGGIGEIRLITVD